MSGLLLYPSMTHPFNYHDPIKLTTDNYHLLSINYDAVKHENNTMTSLRMNMVTFERMARCLTLRSYIPTSACTQTSFSSMSLLNSSWTHCTLYYKPK